MKIKTEKEYNDVMEKIHHLMKKGEKNVTPGELQTIKMLAAAAEGYEDKDYVISAPKTLQGLIELKMYERKLKQKELAKLLKIGEPKLSQILSKKRKPDVAFLKAANEVLGIDPGLLLKYA